MDELLKYKIAEAKEHTHVIMTIEEGQPILQIKLNNNDNYEVILKVIKNWIQNKIQKEKEKYQQTKQEKMLKTISVLEKAYENTKIVTTKEYVRKLIKYTKNSPVYEIDENDYVALLSCWDEYYDQYDYEDRFAVQVHNTHFPEYKNTMYMYDRLKNKFYISDKLHANPRKWNFDFDDNSLKAPKFSFNEN